MEKTRTRKTLQAIIKNKKLIGWVQGDGIIERYKKSKQLEGHLYGHPFRINIWKEKKK